MSRSIAGATKTGAFIERYVVMSRLSATPPAIFPMVEAVAGATTMASAHNPSSTWLFHEPLSLWKKSQRTGRPDNVDSVSGVINSFADGVMTTWTSAPSFTRSLTRSAALYAAMLPLTPKTIFFPLSISQDKLLFSYLFMPRSFMRVSTCLVFNGKSPFIIQP